MIWYVFYKPNLFDSSQALRINCAIQERAEKAALKDLQEMPGAKLLDILPGSAVCPECYHPWDIHKQRCTAEIKMSIEGVLYEHQCSCRRRSRRTPIGANAAINSDGGEQTTAAAPLKHDGGAIFLGEIGVSVDNPADDIEGF